MTYPAWFEFYRDPVIRRHRAACYVYASLLVLDRIFYEPRAVKAWVLAEALQMEKKTILKALNLLVRRGYLVEHDRTQNGVRQFTIATTRPTETPMDEVGSVADDTAA